MKNEQHKSVSNFYHIFKVHMSAWSKISVTLYDKVTLLEVAIGNSREVPNKQDKASTQDRATAMRFI